MQRLQRPQAATEEQSVRCTFWGLGTAAWGGGVGAAVALRQCQLCKWAAHDDAHDTAIAARTVLHHIQARWLLCIACTTF